MLSPGQRTRASQHCHIMLRSSPAPQKRRHVRECQYKRWSAHQVKPYRLRSAVARTEAAIVMVKGVGAGVLHHQQKTSVRSESSNYQAEDPTVIGRQNHQIINQKASSLTICHRLP